jgi:hypothetical protein
MAACLAHISFDKTLLVPSCHCVIHLAVLPMTVLVAHYQKKIVQQHRRRRPSELPILTRIKETHSQYQKAIENGRK